MKSTILTGTGPAREPGKWECDGQTLSYGGWYHIQKNQEAPGRGHGGTWLEHLRRKNWFTPELELEFRKLWEDLHGFPAS